ncbi:MAG: hypothetical protein QM784_14730 [Polyangiaceae bacterium]
MPGSLIAARRIGKAIHTVVSIAELQMPSMETYYYSGCATADATVTSEISKIEAMRARNNAKLDSATFDPGVLAREGTTVLGNTNCSDFYREGIADGTAITTLLFSISTRTQHLDWPISCRVRGRCMRPSLRYTFP